MMEIFMNKTSRLAELFGVFLLSNCRVVFKLVIGSSYLINTPLWYDCR